MARNETAVIIAIAVINTLLAAHFVFLAIGNFARAPWTDVPLFHDFYVALSLATPAFLISAAVCLGYGLVRKHAATWRIAMLSQRLVFWTLVLRATALIGLSLFIPNDSFSATIPFVTGVTYLLLALMVGATCVFLVKRLDRPMELRRNT